VHYYLLAFPLVAAVDARWCLQAEEACGLSTTQVMIQRTRPIDEAVTAQQRYVSINAKVYEVLCLDIYSVDIYVM
jgi:hypothetical protein